MYDQYEYLFIFAVSAKEIYALAVAVFQAKDKGVSPAFTETFIHLVSPPPSVGEDVLQVAAVLFQHAGQQGETNALYTYAQLLRTGVAT